MSKERHYDSEKQMDIVLKAWTKDPLGEHARLLELFPELDDPSPFMNEVCADMMVQIYPSESRSKKRTFDEQNPLKFEWYAFSGIGPQTLSLYDFKNQFNQKDRTKMIISHLYWFEKTCRTHTLCCCVGAVNQKEAEQNLFDTMSLYGRVSRVSLP